MFLGSYPALHDKNLSPEELYGNYLGPPTASLREGPNSGWAMCRPAQAPRSQGNNRRGGHTILMRPIPAFLALLLPAAASAGGFGRASTAPRVRPGPSSLSAPLAGGSPVLSPQVAPAFSPPLSLVPKVSAAPGTEAPSPDSKKTLLETLTAEAPDLDRLPAGEASAAMEADFNARAQLAPPTDVVSLENDFLPALISDELNQASRRLTGSALASERKAAVLAETTVKRIRWYHHFTNDILPVPDGVTYPDSRIALSLRPSWKRYSSVEDHFRVLMTHEYVHRLQNEGVYTRAFGVEIPAVAAELLRAIELAGLDRLKMGHIRFIGEGVLGSFEDGRRWARSDRTARDGFHFKGFMAGAAYELAQMTGRPADAWLFLRRVAAARAPETPSAASARLLK